jgi:hypothetical protein
MYHGVAAPIPAPIFEIPLKHTTGTTRRVRAGNAGALRPPPGNGTGRTAGDRISRPSVLHRRCQAYRVKPRYFTRKHCIAQAQTVGFLRFNPPAIITGPL